MGMSEPWRELCSIFFFWGGGISCWQVMQNVTPVISCIFQISVLSNSVPNWRKWGTFYQLQMVTSRVLFLEAVLTYHQRVPSSCCHSCRGPWCPCTTWQWGWGPRTPCRRWRPPPRGRRGRGSCPPQSQARLNWSRVIGGLGHSQCDLLAF